jgi:endonuclease/exonuclease/phosphatase family metal-dependent hydrolase
MRNTILLTGIFILNFLFISESIAQKNYTIATIGFYNLENLFDTLDTPDVLDTEFSPEGSKLWNAEKYQIKQNNLAKVISELGTNKNKDGVTLLGVSEIENRSVLEDLVNHPALKDRKYRIVHFDSPDRRGIDVALLYQGNRFRVLEAEPLEIGIYDGLDKIFTREILYVKGLLDGEEIYVLVNHWPSRRGGEAKTAPWRAAGAQLCKNVLDSLQEANKDIKMVIMGDLNDDPNSPSVKNILNAKFKIKDVQENGLFNPMAQYFSRGQGSNAYRDTWSLFDQLIISEPFIDNDLTGYTYLNAYVYNKKYLRQKKGHFKGYPFRTFSGDEFLGGYSDHFPVYLHLIKEF